MTPSPANAIHGAASGADPERMGAPHHNKTEYGPDVQNAVTWSRECFFLEVITTPKALPVFTILQEEVFMISSCLIQGLLIAENAG